MHEFSTVRKLVQCCVNVKLPSTFFRESSERPATMGSLRNDDDDGNGNGKKARGLDKQNNNFARASRFFVHFSAVVARLQRETA